MGYSPQNVRRIGGCTARCLGCQTPHQPSASRVAGLERFGIGQEQTDAHVGRQAGGSGHRCSAWREPVAGAAPATRATACEERFGAAGEAGCAEAGDGVGMMVRKRQLSDALLLF